MKAFKIIIAILVVVTALNLCCISPVKWIFGGQSIKTLITKINSVEHNGGMYNLYEWGRIVGKPNKIERADHLTEWWTYKCSDGTYHIRIMKPVLRDGFVAIVDTEKHKP